MENIFIKTTLKALLVYLLKLQLLVQLSTSKFKTFFNRRNRKIPISLSISIWPQKKHYIVSALVNMTEIAYIYACIDITVNEIALYLHDIWTWTCKRKIFLTFKIWQPHGWRIKGFRQLISWRCWGLWFHEHTGPMLFGIHNVWMEGSGSLCRRSFPVFALECRSFNLTWTMTSPSKSANRSFWLFSIYKAPRTPWSRTPRIENMAWDDGCTAAVQEGIEWLNANGLNVKLQHGRL